MSNKVLGVGHNPRGNRDMQEANVGPLDAGRGTRDCSPGAQLEAVEKLLGPAGPQRSEHGTATVDPRGSREEGPRRIETKRIRARMLAVEESDLLQRLAHEDLLARAVLMAAGHGDGRRQMLERDQVSDSCRLPVRRQSGTHQGDRCVSAGGVIGGFCSHIRPASAPQERGLDQTERADECADSDRRSQRPTGGARMFAPGPSSRHVGPPGSLDRQRKG